MAIRLSKNFCENLPDLLGVEAKEEAVNGTRAAIESLYSFLGVDDEETVLNDIEHDYLTVNTCMNGRTALWYLDERYNIAIYTDTAELLSPEEIEKELG